MFEGVTQTHALVCVIRKTLVIRNFSYKDKLPHNTCMGVLQLTFSNFVAVIYSLTSCLALSSYLPATNSLHSSIILSSSSIKSFSGVGECCAGDIKLFIRLDDSFDDTFFIGRGKLNDFTNYVSTARNG